MLMKLARDPQTGKMSLGRTITYLGCIALSFGFYKEAIVNGLVWQDYIAYATGMTIMYAPSKAIELINAIRGNATDPLPASVLDSGVKK